MQRTSFNVKPIEICKHLGTQKIDACYQELSGQEIRAVLKAGGSHTSTPSTAFTQAARRKAWRSRFDAEFAKDNEALALGFLLEWLMRHHRYLLTDYLDLLEVKHDNGETDEDFTDSKSPEELLAAHQKLKIKHDPQHVAVYLLLVGFLQETQLFDQQEELLCDLGMDAGAAKTHAESVASEQAAK